MNIFIKKVFKLILFFILIIKFFVFVKVMVENTEIKETNKCYFIGSPNINILYDNKFEDVIKEASTSVEQKVEDVFKACGSVRRVNKVQKITFKKSKVNFLSYYYANNDYGEKRRRSSIAFFTNAENSPQTIRIMKSNNSLSNTNFSRYLSSTIKEKRFHKDNINSKNDIIDADSTSGVFVTNINSSKSLKSRNFNNFSQFNSTSGLNFNFTNRLNKTGVLNRLDDNSNIFIDNNSENLKVPLKNLKSTKSELSIFSKNTLSNFPLINVNNNDSKLSKNDCNLTKSNSIFNKTGFTVKNQSKCLKSTINNISNKTVSRSVDIKLSLEQYKPKKKNLKIKKMTDDIKYTYLVPSVEQQLVNESLKFKSVKRVFVYPNSKKAPVYLNENKKNIIEFSEQVGKINESSAFQLRKVIYNKYNIALVENELYNYKQDVEYDKSIEDHKKAFREDLNTKNIKKALSNLKSNKFDLNILKRSFHKVRNLSSYC